MFDFAIRCLIENINEIEIKTKQNIKRVYFMIKVFCNCYDRGLSSDHIVVSHLSFTAIEFYKHNDECYVM